MVNMADKCLDCMANKMEVAKAKVIRDKKKAAWFTALGGMVAVFATTMDDSHAIGLQPDITIMLRQF